MVGSNISSIVSMSSLSLFIAASAFAFPLLPLGFFAVVMIAEAIIPTISLTPGLARVSTDSKSPAPAAESSISLQRCQRLYASRRCLRSFGSKCEKKSKRDTLGCDDWDALRASVAVSWVQPVWFDGLTRSRRVMKARMSSASVSWVVEVGKA